MCYHLTFYYKYVNNICYYVGAQLVLQTVPGDYAILIIICVTRWEGYGTYISELIYLVTMYYDTSALVGSDVKYLEPGPLSLPRMHFYCYRLAPSMGRLTTHSTLPMCAGGIPYFVFAVGQLG